MRKPLLYVIVFLSLSAVAKPQQFSGSSTIDGGIYRKGNVSIGTSSTTWPLTVAPQGYAITEDGTNYKIVSDILNHNTYDIPAGVTDNGYRMGLNINGHIRYSDFKGTLNQQIGIRIQHGAYTGAGPGTIKNVYGLLLQGLDQGESTIENKFGIYQLGPGYKNYFQGETGFGTKTPTGMLEVANSKGATLSISTNKTNGSSSSPKHMTIDFLGYQNGNKARIRPEDITYNMHGSKPPFFVNNGRSSTGLEEHMAILHTGNVGIGCTNPKSRLAVNGTINAKEVKVTSTVPCSDYVFQPSYNLRSLEEVEQFVKENRHLPEVPSAAEFKENGYSVGEMDDILLRKVEELTLYIIKQQKLIGQLQTEVEQLKTKE